MKINELIKTLVEASKHAWFVSLEYTAKGTGDVARYVIQPGVSYSRQISNSITALAIMLRQGLEEPMLEAAQELLESFQLSSEGRNYSASAEEYMDIDDPETGYPVHGLRQHIQTGQIEVFGVIRSKVLHEAGDGRKPHTYRNELTKAKAELRKALPIGHWRAFDIALITACNGLQVEQDREPTEDRIMCQEQMNLYRA
jgi:hypothetical protein